MANTVIPDAESVPSKGGLISLSSLNSHFFQKQETVIPVAGPRELKRLGLKGGFVWGTTLACRRSVIVG
jgi:hypothetical protein